MQQGQHLHQRPGTVAVQKVNWVKSIPYGAKRSELQHRASFKKNHHYEKLGCSWTRKRTYPEGCLLQHKEPLQWEEEGFHPEVMLYIGSFYK